MDNTRREKFSYGTTVTRRSESPYEGTTIVGGVSRRMERVGDRFLDFCVLNTHAAAVAAAAANWRLSRDLPLKSSVLARCCCSQVPVVTGAACERAAIYPAVVALSFSVSCFLLCFCFCPFSMLTAAWGN